MTLLQNHEIQYVRSICHDEFAGIASFGGALYLDDKKDVRVYPPMDPPFLVEPDAWVNITNDPRSDEMCVFQNEQWT